MALLSLAYGIVCGGDWNGLRVDALPPPPPPPSASSSTEPATSEPARKEKRKSSHSDGKHHKKAKRDDKGKGKAESKAEGSKSRGTERAGAKKGKDGRSEKSSKKKSKADESSRRHDKGKTKHSKDKRGRAKKPKDPMEAFVVTALSDESSKRKPKSEFLCRVEYGNTLPDVPLDARFLRFPFAKDRLVKYAASGLQRSIFHDLMPERMLGIDVDLIDVSQYQRPLDVARGDIEAGDLPLMKSEKKEAAGLRAQRARPNVSWLRKGIMLANDLYTSNVNPPSQLEPEKESAQAKQARIESESHDAQIEAIEETFQLAKQPPVHRTNPSMQIAQILPILPDDDLERASYSFATFDAKPAEQMTRKAAQTSTLSIANMTAEEVAKEFSHHAVLVEHTEKFYGLYMPSNRPAPPLSSSAPIAAHVADREHFEWVREYVVKPSPNADRSDNFFFKITPSAVKYAHYDHRVTLRKRAKTVDDPCEDEVASRPASVVVNLVE